MKLTMADLFDKKQFMIFLQSQTILKISPTFSFQEMFTKDCKFKENVFENYWCIYSSIEYKDPESSKLQYFGMNRKGRPIRGSKGRKFKEKLS